MRNLISAPRHTVFLTGLAAAAALLVQPVVRPALAETTAAPAATATPAAMAAPAATPVADSPALKAFTPEQQQAIGVLVKAYIAAHPEIVQDALDALDKRQKEADAEKARMTIKDNKATLFNSPHEVVLGNPQGNVTMVEFFDYNCAFCKRALPDMMSLLNSNPNLRFVLKEFPVLGDGSVEAAHVAVAARMQDPTGKKYIEFHQKLLGGRGAADKTRALAVAKEVGFDMTRIEKDMNSPEVKTTIDEDMKLADLLGVSGTPTYVVGDEVVVGAVGLDELKKKLNPDAAAGQSPGKAAADQK
ncbi:MAG TPA: DsbA family protein [Xanthobacteraceae bacterium]|nr:DsbA family protein [Xanthobacteraceae bacterium]